MLRYSPLWIVLSLLLGAATAERPATYVGKCTRVIDGDICWIERQHVTVKVRLACIDAPEHDQARGKEATAALSAKLLGKTVRVLPQTIDRYGRTVAQLEVDGESINRAQVEAGWAHVYTEYIPKKQLAEWLKLQETAKEKHVGVWQDKDPQRPSDFRKGKK